MCCSAFMEKNKCCIIKQHQNKYNQRVFYSLLPYVCFSYFRWVKFCSGCFRQFFFIRETKVVAGSIRQVAILYSNNCMRICLAGINSHRGGHLNRFDSTSKTESTEYSVFLLYFVLLKQKFYSTHQYLASTFVRHTCK